MRIFIDSDVVISFLISNTGAAFYLLNQSQIEPVISSISQIELRIVTKRLNLDETTLNTLIKGHLEVINLTKELKYLKEEYEKFVTDINDAHIVAGAHSANLKYLITYNLKHYKLDKIKDELNIIILTPALFLQYLRSQ